MRNTATVLAVFILAASCTKEEDSRCPPGQKYVDGHSRAQIRGRGCYSGKRKRVLQGKWEFFYQNGQKMAEATYKDSKLDGEKIEWHENGQMKWKGTWQGGKEEGVHSRWHENGQTESQSTFKAGALVDEKHWDESGQAKQVASPEQPASPSASKQDASPSASK